MTRHVDVVSHRPWAMMSILRERLPEGHPRAVPHVGSYSHVSEPHTDADCPFRSGDRLPMVSVPFVAL